MHIRNQHNVVTQLYFNKKKLKIHLFGDTSQLGCKIS